jgi:hypothetical protein
MRKSISWVLAGLLTFAPALAFLFLPSDWEPRSWIIGLSCIGSLAGVIWLYDEVLEFRERRMVVIRQKMERKMLVNGLLALIPEAIIAWIVAIYTASGVVGFILTMLGLLGVYFLIWVKNSLWMWLMYWVSARRKMSEHLGDYLVQNRFPAPPQYVGGIDDYFDQVANSEQCDCPTRVKAAIELGTFVGLKLAGRMQLGLQLHLAYEDALERYARRFPPPDDD